MDSPAGDQASGIRQRDLHGAVCAGIFHFGGQNAARCLFLDCFCGLLPGGVFDAVKAENFVAGMKQTGLCARILSLTPRPARVGRDKLNEALQWR